MSTILRSWRQRCQAVGHFDGSTRCTRNPPPPPLSLTQTYSSNETSYVTAGSVGVPRRTRIQRGERWWGETWKRRRSFSSVSSVCPPASQPVSFWILMFYQSYRLLLTENRSTCEAQENISTLSVSDFLHNHFEWRSGALVSITRHSTPGWIPGKPITGQSGRDPTNLNWTNNSFRMAEKSLQHCDLLWLTLWPYVWPINVMHIETNVCVFVALYKPPGVVF